MNAPGPSHRSRASALAGLAVVVAVIGAGGCATVSGHLEAGRLYDACVLANDGGGAFEEDYEAQDAVTAAVAAAVHLEVAPLSSSELTALLGEAPRDDVNLLVARLKLAAPAEMVVHEERCYGALDDDDTLRMLHHVLPSIDDPPPLLLPPGPLVIPEPPEPRPPAPSGGGGRRRGGLMDAFVGLVTLPFQIVGAVAEALIRIPFDLFGGAVPRGTQASSPQREKNRMPGEAILPQGAFDAEKARLEAEHAAAVADAAAARDARAVRLAAVADRFRARCVVDGAPCERLVIGTGPLSMAVWVGIRGPSGAPADGCPVAGPVTAQSTTSMSGWPVSSPLPPAWATPTSPPTSREKATAPADVDALADDVVAARVKSTAKAATVLPELACAVRVDAKWRRFVKSGELTVRLAAGRDVGVGATLNPKAALNFSVGAAVPVHIGDHVKLVVAGEGGYVGGAVGVFDGALPIRLDGANVQATCR